MSISSDVASASEISTSEISANEISTSEISTTWIKSSHSGPTGGNCVEIAFVAGGGVAMRNSRHPEGPTLTFTRAEWDAFLSGASDGEFSHPD